MPNTSPVTAWKALKEGNERFVAGEAQHPHQSLDHRSALTNGQHPIAAVLGCSDSRVPVEIAFDQGLGDIFTVRTAGHVLDSAVLGSLEYAVTALGVRLIVVLGHSSCGAVTAAVSTADGEAPPSGHIRDVVDRIMPSVLAGRHAGFSGVGEFVTKHVNETVAQLRIQSAPVAEGLAAGSLAIVGLTYGLSDGRVVLRDHIGDIGEG
ncbi:carbonic anhydrase [Mycobacterium deserti]|uniref:Carbonic anhydrase n=1 Tax=Mycobacterium deserti TaxID=2978347 RepID=A0ABT2M6Q2_9MYCO|nr:carbonic anhydrase [Mycobacterium deserti]MCT7657935.1 carbonic anhydrase [Mycobacterium deserti]